MSRNKLKINLLTFNSALSYGAVLQTYALARVLEELDCDVEIIDFRAPFLPPVPTGLWSLKTYYSLTRFRKEILFYRFRKKYLNKKTRAIYSLEGLKKFKFEADYFVVGSDQVWNPDITKKYAAVYFLDFVKGKKLSYAASFGKNHWNYDETFNKTIIRLLNDFSAISVREEDSLKILSGKFGQHGTAVLDPTLLLKDYSEFVPDFVIKDQISCISVNNSKTPLIITSKIQEELGLPAFVLDAKKLYNRVLPVPFISVQDWLKYIAESKLVITDSFHGVAFCIIFQKQFIAIKTHPARFIRIKDLLDRLGLSDRIFERTDMNGISELIRKEIDYSAVNLKLHEMKIRSMNFLREHLLKVS